MYTESPIDPVETVPLPPPLKLTERMREDDPETFYSLWADELSQNNEEIFRHHKNSHQGSLGAILSRIEWGIGNSGVAIEWWEDRL